MARWHAGWTGGGPPPAPADVLVTGITTVLYRANGNGPWLLKAYNAVGAGDTVLTLEFGQWEPQLKPTVPSPGTILCLPGS